MDETIDTAIQSDEYTEVGNRLDLARNLVIAIKGRRKFCPGIRLALLDAQ